MANIKSQIKRNRQNEVAHERNKAVKTGLKSAVRKFRELAEAGDKDAALDAAQVASKKLDSVRTPSAIDSPLANDDVWMSETNVLVAPSLSAPAMNDCAVRVLGCANRFMIRCPRKIPSKNSRPSRCRSSRRIAVAVSLSAFFAVHRQRPRLEHER